ncbi:methyl-CpG-binding domain protein 3 [Planococcus citri]|uniref:methyl-CpG-binding domain protein 3 n=1 Tax=Planococcus citri TaxID=170843 RepID=UPI0031F7A727
MSMEKNLYDSSLLSKSWQRDDPSRKPTLPSTGSKPDPMYFYNRTVRNDASLVPPIRQTASIFKQPVTVHKNQESVVKYDLKYGPQEKPKQLFWEKRLEGLRAYDTDGFELRAMDLPLGLKAVGPHVSQETLLQSVATALHVSNHPVTGQTGSRSNLDKNSGVFLNPDQPLIQAVSICEEDIKKQEDKVNSVRKKLQDAIKCIS